MWVLPVLSLLLLAAVVYHLAGMYEIWHFVQDLRQGISDHGPFPPITVFKPLAHWNTEIRENLRTFCEQDYPGPWQILVGPKAAFAEQVRSTLACHVPEAEVTVVPCPEEGLAVNPKVNQLLQMDAAARYPYLVVVDEDMRVPRHYLRAVAAGLRHPDVGVVTCLYVVKEPPTRPALLEAMLIQGTYVVGIMVGRRLLGMRFAFGSTLGIRRDVLDALGGWAALGDYLADDYQLAYQAFRRGYRVALLPILVESRLPPMTWRDLVRHQLRWARTNRACQPVGWFFSIITHLSLWGTLWWLASGFSPAGWQVLVLTWVFRAVEHVFLNALLEGLSPPWRGLLWLPVQDALAFLTWLGSFLTDTVVWAGRTYRVFPDGTMQLCEAEEAVRASEG